MPTSERAYNAILRTWRDILRRPPQQWVDLITRAVQDQNGAWITREDVAAFFSTTLQQTPRSISEEVIDVPVDDDGPHTDRKPNAITFGGEHIRLQERRWDEMIVAVCAKVASENPLHIGRVLKQITSSRDRVYFSEKPAPLKRGASIGTTGIYVELNVSANNAVSLCRALAKLFGYDQGVEVEHV